MIFQQKKTMVSAGGVQPIKGFRMRFRPLQINHRHQV